jgi:hypothetical protein
MCAICELAQTFSIEHPLALAVAVATRDAIEAGRLPALGDKARSDGPLNARRRAIETLQGVQRRLEAALAPERLIALPDVYVLLIENGTWGFFRATPAGFDTTLRPEAPDIDADDPRDRDPVVVTSEAAARELVAGRLSFDRAAADGLVVFDADEDRREALTEAWRAAWPAAGVSRFACG